MAKLETIADPLEDHLRPGEADSADPDYQAWKDRKIRRALAQSEDRTQMIPAEEVWDSFGS
ncbi:hypothetical protein QO010_003668 [Caulobacter ginsengisoli]|uniref:Addiction module protein n=1 Tax=Caulobacter ginsengisoli TaxID=400775 RepID=A0ABU0IV32_9CAUL|nr:hypothetical protein [Caulobacter ginsengisoli]MDQ0465876.1 hypothetical protein [Caulobacter ginsengisoli]